MNALTAYIAAKTAERELHYCPACRDRHDQDDMDLSNAWEHSLAMRAKYGAACCNACTDDHIMTADGVLMRYADTVQGYDERWSSEDALADAVAEAGYHAADQAMYRGWV